MRFFVWCLTWVMLLMIGFVLSVTIRVTVLLRRRLILMRLRCRVCGPVRLCVRFGIRLVPMTVTILMTLRCCRRMRPRLSRWFTVRLRGPCLLVRRLRCVLRVRGLTCLLLLLVMTCRTGRRLLLTWRVIFLVSVMITRRLCVRVLMVGRSRRWVRCLTLCFLR